MADDAYHWCGRDLLSASGCGSCWMPYCLKVVLRKRISSICNFAARMSLYLIAAADSRCRRRSKYEKDTSDIKGTTDINDYSSSCAGCVTSGMRARKLFESAVCRQ